MVLDEELDKELDLIVAVELSLLEVDVEEVVTLMLDVVEILPGICNVWPTTRFVQVTVGFAEDKVAKAMPNFAAMILPVSPEPTI